MAQDPRPGVGLLHLRGRQALGDQRRPQSQLQVEFLLDPRRGLGERGQQLQPLGEMPERFLMGRALHRLFARIL